MTREEAKEILTHNWTRVDNPNYSESELDEAYDMAIEALSAVCDDCIWHVCNYNSINWDAPSAEASQNLAKTNKALKGSDLIRRQDAIEAVCVDTCEHPYSECESKQDCTFVTRIKALPSAEAVQVVRCKDCKHRDLFSCPLTDNDFQKDEDYCSWGERKGGDDE